MLLYNITFPKKSVCVENELYLRGGECREDGVFIKSGERVTFDTFFNCFSHTKYKKYTRVDEVDLRLSLKGMAEALVYLYDGENHKLLAQKEICGEDCINLKLTDLEDKGIVYFALEAKEDCILHSGGWYADAESDSVRIGIVICTYRREEYVKRNLGNLTAYMRGLDNRFFDVFVIDNGKTLSDEFGEGIRIIPNENTGGSGGFSRGMKEVCGAGVYTHFLLMDDDIVFDVDTLWRTYSLLCLLKEEYKNASIGGAMLTADKPYIQMEMGADWDGAKIFPHRKRVDVRNAVEIVKNEADGAFDYSGWFYLCMPADAPEKYGYPLPLFIKCDDMEYGLRAVEHFISTSGIAVWHEDFEVKYVPEIEYYKNRNELILNAYFPKGKGAFANYKKLVSRTAKQLFTQRYYALDLIFKAYKDFFKGPDFLFSLDGAKNHKEIRERCPVFLTAEEIERDFGITVDKALMDKPSRPKRGFGFKNIVTFNGYLIPKCFYKRSVGQADMLNFDAADYFMRKKVLQFNTVTGKGFVTEIKKAPFVKACFKLIGYFFKMAFCYRSVAKKYRRIDLKAEKI